MIRSFGASICALGASFVIILLVSKSLEYGGTCIPHSLPYSSFIRSCLLVRRVMVIHNSGAFLGIGTPQSQSHSGLHVGTMQQSFRHSNHHSTVASVPLGVACGLRTSPRPHPHLNALHHLMVIIIFGHNHQSNHRLPLACESR